MLDELRASAPPNVEMLGWVDDDHALDLVAGCRAFLMPNVEDFGIAPVEAMAAGRPVIAFGEGGVVDSVRDLDRVDSGAFGSNASPTGFFYSDPTPTGIGDRRSPLRTARASLHSARNFRLDEAVRTIGVASRIQRLDRRVRSIARPTALAPRKMSFDLCDEAFDGSRPTCGFRLRFSTRAWRSFGSRPPLTTVFGGSARPIGTSIRTRERSFSPAPNGVTATCQVQIIGTFNTLDDSWMWGWDHPSVDPPSRRNTPGCVASFGEKHGIDYLTAHRLEGSNEDDAWQTDRTRLQTRRRSRSLSRTCRYRRWFSSPSADLGSRRLMADYDFVTRWSFNAPIERVWGFIADAERWPTWWKYVAKVEVLEPGDETGVGRVLRMTWRTRLPYSFRSSSDRSTSIRRSTWKAKPKANSSAKASGGCDRSTTSPTSATTGTSAPPKRG